MPESLKSPKLVIIYDDFRDPMYRDLAKQGVEQAEWDPLVFSDLQDALEAFTPSIKALITGVEARRSSSGASNGRYPARALIGRSDELETPRGLMSGHPAAYNFIRNENDVFIPKVPPKAIPGEIFTWLRAIDIARNGR